MLTCFKWTKGVIWLQQLWIKSINKCKFTQFLAPGTGQNQKRSPGTNPKFPEKIYSGHMNCVSQALQGRGVSTYAPLFRIDLQIPNNLLTNILFKCYPNKDYWRKIHYILFCLVWQWKKIMPLFFVQRKYIITQIYNYCLICRFFHNDRNTILIF